MKNLLRFQQIIIVSIVVLVGMFSANGVKACICASSSLESAIEEHPNVVILKLQSVEKYGENEKGYDVDNIKQSSLSVEKVFKGNLKIGQSLIFSQGNGVDCILTFDEERIGTEYLFFLGGKPKKNKLWTVYVCNRSNFVKGAAADLMYLEKLSKVKGETRLSGTLDLENKPAVEGEKGSYELLAGRTVAIKGNNKNIKLKTDENGVYEIYDLPVGKYQVTPEKISGYKFDDKGKESAEVEIKAESLTEQDFAYTIDNSISGVLFDAKGKLLENVSLHLLPARGNKHPYFFQGDYTDAQGYFKFDEIPAGTYFIVINEDGEITSDSPFGTFYYPNKINREEAAEITIGAGDHFKELTITAPTTAETIAVSGVLTFDDGKPAFNEAVNFFNNIEDLTKIKKYNHPDSRVTINEKGEFTIKILKGQKGIMFGSMISFIGEYEKCPKLDKLIRAKGDSIQDIETPTVQIEAENDASGVELKFPFPSCKKAREE